MDELSKTTKAIVLGIIIGIIVNISSYFILLKFFDSHEHKYKGDGK